MIDVVFDPWDLTGKGEEGDSLLEIALEYGIPLQHACGGDAVCSTCAVRVIKGEVALSDMEDLEEETLDKLLPDRTANTRLACQTRIVLESRATLVRVISLEEQRLPSA